MRYGSVCSGIEAASVAWEPLGWQPAWFAEIEAFPSAVLAHHWPHVENLGDMTLIADMVRSGWVEAPDILVGGTPCQAFSVAGLREGLWDARGQLTLEFIRLANAIDEQREEPALIVWENVPGVLSSKDNAFGCFLAGLAGESDPLEPPGGKWANAGCVFGPQRAVAWRVLDAQYFGVAQRRRRVFVVASAADGFDPTAVLFEFDGLRRDTAPSREARQTAAANSGSGVKVRSHWDGTENPHPTLSQSHNTGGIGQSNQELFSQRGAGLVWPAEIASTLNACFAPKQGLEDQHVNGGCPLFVPVLYCGTQNDAFRDLGVEVAPTLRSGSGGGVINQAINHQNGVRRLTPTECERLQGFPDGHTGVPYRNKPASDGPRYKALGNSMAVPCMHWIGARIYLHLLGFI